MFKRQPLDYLLDEDGKSRHSAVDALKRYISTFDGRFFEELADTANPYRFTSMDLLALQALGGLTIPTTSAINLIRDTIPGREGKIAECLSKIPVSATLWDVEKDWLDDGAAQELWGLVSGPHVRRTKTSKLLAAKRPLLFPIYDRYVAGGLLDHPDDDYWVAWRSCFTSPTGESLLAACCLIRELALGEAASLSPLRVLDIVIWMHETGEDTRGA